MFAYIHRMILVYFFVARVPKGSSEHRQRRGLVVHVLLHIRFWCLLFEPALISQERARSWKVEIGKASKLISQLNNVCNAISVCDAKITKQPDVLEADMKTGFDEVKKQMREWKEQATSLIATSAEKMLAEDPVALPVTVADAVTQIKASQNLLKDVRSSYANEAKAKKAAADVNKTPKAKAAPKAAKSKAAPGKGKR